MTRPIIIDADAFMAFYREEVLSSPNTDVTGSALPVIALLGLLYSLFVDDGDQVLSEWITVTADEHWVRGWLGDRLALGDAHVIPAPPGPTQVLIRALRQQGFPHTSRDVWYLRTANAAKARSPNAIAYILSEDLHFYEPSAKPRLRGERRKRFMLSRQGSVLKALTNAGIEVFCCGNCPTI